jgi:hypothetical protein
MMYRYRELVVLFSILLACLGSFLIYDSLASAAHSEGLGIILGACCCSLAATLLYYLIVALNYPNVPEAEEDEVHPKK